MHALRRFVTALLLKTQLGRDLRDGRAVRWRRESGDAFPIFLDYEVHPVPRYGSGKAPHPELFELLNAGRERYADMLRRFLQFRPALQAIPLQKPLDPATPYWLNRYFQGLDPLSLYGLAALHNPRLHVEVGSGNSTKFMRRAIRDQRLRTQIVSIDPHPRAEVDALCDEVRRQPLEEVDLQLFEQLSADDILFIDGSHRVFMNSDVTVLFLEVLPRLKPGVLIYIDDIYLPLDYPAAWSERYYSEQYMLAVLLLSGTDRFEVVLPCNFVVNDPALLGIVGSIWNDSPIREAGKSGGNGFWLRKTR
jgi:hypothetical protein